MAKVALLIGVGKYGLSSGFKNLAAAEPDVGAMRQVLVHPEIGGFAEADVATLLNPDSQQIRIALNRLFSDRKLDDLVVVYFSGHGVVDDFGVFHLTSTETEKGLLNSTAIPASFLHVLMETSRSKKQVVILDCCFSGAFAKGMAAKGGAVNLRAQLGGRGRAVLTSSSATEYSFEQKEASLSVYTQYVVEGLQTGIADQNGDGMISVDELHEFARAKVQDVAPAMRPEIYAVQEGYKIVVAKAPVGDPKLEYRKEVERLVKQRNGTLSPILRRGLTERFRGRVSTVEADKILYEVLQPYREFEEKLKKFEDAVTEFAELPTEQQFHEDIDYVQESLGLRDEDVATIKRKPGIGATSKTAEDLLDQGVEKYNSQDYQGAIADFDQAIKFKPDDALVYANRGAAHGALGESNAAIADYDQAIKLKPDYAGAYFGRGNARSNLGDNKAAINDYDQTIKLKPDDGEAYFNRGNARSNLGDNKAAINDYNQAIKLNPDNATAYSGRGNARSNLGDNKAAINDYDQAIKLNSDYATAYYNRGITRSALGDKQSAILDYQKAAKLYKNQDKPQDYQDALNQIKKLQQ